MLCILLSVDSVWCSASIDKVLVVSTLFNLICCNYKNIPKYLLSPQSAGKACTWHMLYKAPNLSDDVLICCLIMEELLLK